MGIAQLMALTASIVSATSQGVSEPSNTSSSIAFWFRSSRRTSAPVSAVFTTYPTSRSACATLDEAAVVDAPTRTRGRSTLGRRSILVGSASCAPFIPTNLRSCEMVASVKCQIANLASSDLLLQVLVVPSFPIFEGAPRICHDPRDNGDHGRAVRRQLPESFEQTSYRSKPIY